jgi:hypothetical protein
VLVIACVGLGIGYWGLGIRCVVWCGVVWLVARVLMYMYVFLATSLQRAVGHA